MGNQPSNTPPRMSQRCPHANSNQKNTRYSTVLLSDGQNNLLAFLKSISKRGNKCYCAFACPGYVQRADDGDPPAKLQPHDHESYQL